MCCVLFETSWYYAEDAKLTVENIRRMLREILILVLFLYYLEIKGRVDEFQFFWLLNIKCETLFDTGCPCHVKIMFNSNAATLIVSVSTKCIYKYIV